MIDLTGLTVPCDGKCGCDEFHTGHLADGWERILNAAVADDEEEE